MSSTLYWQCLPSLRDRHALPYQLKALMARHFWDHDGSLSGDSIVIMPNSVEDAFIAGLAAAGVEGAEELLVAVREHQGVEVYIAA
jgi:hypothetical protein